MSGLSPSIERIILNGPAMPPPPGVVSNFDHPDTLSVYVVPTITLAITFSTLALLMRLYTQRAIGKPLYWEDRKKYGSFSNIAPANSENRHCSFGMGKNRTSILVFQLLIILGNVHWFYKSKFHCGTSCRSSSVGHSTGGIFHDALCTTSPEYVMEKTLMFLQWSNLVQILYGPVIFVVKLSILLQYLRIFVPTRRGNLGMYIGLCVVFGSHLAFYIVVTFFQIFSCSPREATWNKLIAHKHCFDLPAMFVASGVVNVVSDLVILALPIYSIWKLQISTRQKIQVSAAFATGFLVCLAFSFPF